MPELPKISALVKNLAVPEKEFENFVKGMGVEIPRGPLTVLTTFLESFERGEAPKLPLVPTPTREKEMRPMEEETLSEEEEVGEMVEEMAEVEAEERGKGKVY